MRHWITLLVLLPLVCPVAAHAEIFKRVLPDGTVVYTDEPHPEAEEIEPPPIQVIPTPPPPPGARAQQPADREQDTPASYTGVRITAPADDAVIWDDQGDVTVRVVVDPELHAERGDRLVLIMDGRQVAGPATATTFALDEVFRGTHVLRAEVRGSDGDTVTASPAVTFHMKQHSMLFPKNRDAQP